MIQQEGVHVGNYDVLKGRRWALVTSREQSDLQPVRVKWKGHYPVGAERQQLAAHKEWMRVAKPLLLG